MIDTKCTLCCHGLCNTECVNDNFGGDILEKLKEIIEERGEKKEKDIQQIIKDVAIIKDVLSAFSKFNQPPDTNKI